MIDSGGGQAGSQDSEQARFTRLGQSTSGGVVGDRSGISHNRSQAARRRRDQSGIRRKQTDCPCSISKDEMAKDKTELLEQLGWSREDATRFIERWQKMEQAAEQAGPQGEKGRSRWPRRSRALVFALRHAVAGRRNYPRYLNKILREARHTDTPADWAEQVREYTKGVATGGR